jgi:hypothetical protein
MPRNPQTIIPFRGPFEGLVSAPRRRTPPLATNDCLNVLTEQGDIRRRPGLGSLLSISQGTDWTPVFVARMAPMMIYDDAGDRHPTEAKLILAGQFRDGGYGEKGGLRVLDVQGAGSGDAWATHTRSYNAGALRLHSLGFAVIDNQHLVYRSSGAGPGSDWGAARARDKGTATWEKDVGLCPAPPSSLGRAEGGADVDTDGTYEFAAVFYAAASGAVSAPAYAEAITVTDHEIDLTVAATSETQVSHVRLYVRNTAVDSHYYLFKELPVVMGTATTWTYDHAQAPDKTEANKLDVLQGYVVGPGREVAYWRERLWLDIEGGSDIAYSDYAKWWSFRVTQQLQTGVANEDYMQRMLPAAGALFILRRNSIWTITGSGPESFQVQQVADVGCGGQGAAIAAEGAIWFANGGGCYRLSETGVELLSGSIREQWQRFTRLEYMSLAFDSARKLLLVSGMTGFEVETGAYTSQLLVYDVARRHWWRWHLTQNDDLKAPLGVGLCKYDYGGGPVVALFIPSGEYDTPGGAILRLRGDAETTQSDYFNDPVAWHWDIGPTDMGTPYPKRIHSATLAWDADSEATGETIELVVYGDHGTGTTYQVTDDLAGATATILLGITCRDVRFRLQGSTYRRPRIVGLEIEAEIVGQMP